MKVEKGFIDVMGDLDDLAMVGGILVCMKKERSWQMSIGLVRYQPIWGTQNIFNFIEDFGGSRCLPIVCIACPLICQMG